jgi:hypothetical protein
MGSRENQLQISDYDWHGIFRQHSVVPCPSPRQLSRESGHFRSGTRQNLLHNPVLKNAKRFQRESLA